MRTGGIVLLVALAGNAAAQQSPGAGGIAAPMATQQGTAASQRQPAASRNQFFNPVMGIQIEGEGLTLPKGVAEDPLVKPPAQPAAEPQPGAPAAPPPATPK